MAVTLNDKHLQKFIAEDEMVGMAGMVAAAHSDISEKKGLGSDYLGWVDLPVTYDREEFARILAAAEKNCAHGGRFAFFFARGVQFLPGLWYNGYGSQNR